MRISCFLPRHQPDNNAPGRSSRLYLELTRRNSKREFASCESTPARLIALPSCESSAVKLSRGKTRGTSRPEYWRSLKEMPFSRIVDGAETVMTKVSSTPSHVSKAVKLPSC